ncbi:MAG: NHL repeat-containing protein [Anaerolineae bacterium]|nr:NHL repeat-containing protein [Anaerolineae bacterium]
MNRYHTTRWQMVTVLGATGLILALALSGTMGAYAQDDDSTPVPSGAVKPPVKVAEWSIEGEPDVVLSGPDGEVFVVTDGSQITRFGPGGELLATWSVDGVIETNGIVIGPAGDVFVTVNNNYHVVRFDGEGTVLAEWSLEAFAVDGVIETNGLVVGPNGDVFVTVNNNYQVVRFDGEGTVLAEWSLSAYAVGGVIETNGLAVGPNGDVFVTVNNNYHVVRFDGEGNVLAEWSLDAYAVGGVIETNGLVVGPNGDVFVTINNSHQVMRFSPDGDLLAEWSVQGELDAMLNLSMDRSGRIIGVDEASGLIQIFEP